MTTGTLTRSLTFGEKQYAMQFLDNEAHDEKESFHRSRTSGPSSNRIRQRSNSSDVAEASSQADSEGKGVRSVLFSARKSEFKANFERPQEIPIGIGDRLRSRAKKWALRS